jgi:eukaryotic-like serine/threonine-protein kinase
VAETYTVRQPRLFPIRFRPARSILPRIAFYSPPATFATCSLIGQTLTHYEITGLLGKGGMGEVYRARDTRLDRDVALKILPASLGADPARLERFDREAKTVAALNHPHIVHMYSVEEDQGIRFLTMELVEGEELEARVPAEGLALRDALEIGIAIADALTEAHAKGVVHRDLKPSNVMVTTEGRVKVLDFGLAKLAKSDVSTDATVAGDGATRALGLTQQGAILGTAPYMSPEQLRGQDVDGRTDIFALGIMLHELATGRKPFAGDTLADVMSSILKDEPTMA